MGQRGPCTHGTWTGEPLHTTGSTLEPCDTGKDETRPPSAEPSASAGYGLYNAPCVPYAGPPQNMSTPHPCALPTPHDILCSAPNPKAHSSCPGCDSDPRGDCGCMWTSTLTTDLGPAKPCMWTTNTTPTLPTSVGSAVGESLDTQL